MGLEDLTPPGGAKNMINYAPRLGALAVALKPQGPEGMSMSYLHYSFRQKMSALRPKTFSTR